MKNWKCTICNYIHNGDAPPDVCPICGADKSFFVAVKDELLQKTKSENVPETAPEQAEETAETVKGGSERQWKCTICGYIHTGEEPPDICPICAADKSFFIEITPAASSEEKKEEKTEPQQQDTAQEESSKEEKKERFGWIGKLIVRLHLHPISVHTPNGIIPIALIFLVLAMVFGYAPLEKASFFNLIVVFLSMPAVLFTGFVVWQKKYNGALTSVFKIKLVAAATVAVLTSILVFWRIIDPEIAFAGGTGSWIYLGVGGVNLLAAGIAGHIGGKLALR